MKDLLFPVLLTTSTALGVFYYVCLARFAPEGGKVLSLKGFFPFWLAAFTIEFFILGPYSFINMGTEGAITVVMDHYLAQFHDGGRFSHRFGGGQDMYIWSLGMQYFQPEKWLFHFMPTWLVIEAHKLMVGTLGFVGSYLLAKRVAPSSETIALALGAAYPVFHIYMTAYSTTFGTGFAAIPLVVYWCLGCMDSKRYWWLVGASAVILAAADPMKVFPPLLVAYVGCAILIEGVKIRRAAAVFVIFVVVSVLNWHEVLYAHVVSAPFVGRGLLANIEGSATLTDAIAGTVYSVISYWLPAGLFIVSLGILIRRMDGFAMRAVAAGAWVFLSMVIADAFPWDWVGLSFLNRLSHQQYMVLALGTIVIPVAACALSRLERIPMPMLQQINLRPSLVLLALALGVLTWQKGYNAVIWLYGGGQAVYSGINALANPSWDPKPGYRTVTFYEIPRPNVVAGYYGFDTFGGGVNLNSKRWTAYWVALLHGNEKHGLGTRLGWYWKFWNGEEYDVERHVRLDLLAVANVRYLFSPLPLNSPSLKLLHAPSREKWARVRPEFFEGLLPFLQYRFKRVFDPGDIFVYELPEALPRAFAVTNVVSVLETKDETDFFDAVADNAINGAAVAWSSVASRLGDAMPMEVSEITAVLDGYDISVFSPKGGILALNQTPLPFWRAYDQDGQLLVPEPVNGVHMAVKLPPAISLVRFRYERPLLRERLFN